MRNLTFVIIFMVIFILSLSLHEIGHATAAHICGDDTAKDQGRISFNVFRHLDPLGTFLPFVMLLSGSDFIFGWAKPVPINYLKLKNGRLGEFIVSIAGVTVNFILCIIGAVFLKYYISHFTISRRIVDIITRFILMNIGLGIFNLIPCPPLDGSRIIASLLPEHLREGWFKVDRFGVVIVILLSYTGMLGKIIDPIFDIIIKIIRIYLKG